MPHPRNRIRMAVAVAMLGVFSGLLSPASADEAPEAIYPEMAGETTIHASGVTGVKLRVPQDILWFADNIEWSVSPDVNKFSMAIRFQWDASDLCDLCFLGTYVSGTPKAPHGSTYDLGECSNDPGEEIGCYIKAGIVEMYFVSDGETSITMRFPELSGSLELQATGEVDGSVERIPGECLDPDCTVVTGHTVETIGENGRAALAGVSAWGWAYPGTANPRESTAVACAYPGYFNPGKSPDPADHPFGCDISDPEDNSSGFLLPDVGPNGGGIGWSDGSGKTHGAQYLGFTARAVTTLEPKSIEAWALWVHEGIGCPSNDFFDCT